MVNLRILLFTAIFAATVFMFITTVGSEPSTNVAAVFLNKLREADKASVIALFGDNSCHCQPRGGYVAYLTFRSGENDNLAFLYGQKFKTGTMSEKAIPTVEKVKSFHLPWEEPESTEVDVPISFVNADDRPYLLPLDSAFGYPLKESELTDFCNNPAGDFWKALSLRLRPSLAKGVVPAAGNAKSAHASEFMSDVFSELLSPEQAKYLRPSDAGDIIAVDGKKKAAAEYATRFPRLSRGTLRLYMGRRGKYQCWTVKKGRLKDPVFALSEGKELELRTPESALVDIRGPAVESLENMPPFR